MRAASLSHMLLLLACTADALRVDGGSAMSSRRAAIIGAVGAVLPNAASASKRSELISDNGSGCVYGEGDGCAALAEGNELILKLQKKSRDNRAKNELELYEKTVAMLGYDDALMTVDRVMVRVSAQGKYAALSLEDYYAAKKAGRISSGDNGIENLAPEVVVADASDGS